MKKKDEIMLTIEDVNFPNKAYGLCEGERVTVKNGALILTWDAPLLPSAEQGLF